MKIIKSKRGYFYKVYKNGKKVRISKEKYLKFKNNNKKRKKTLRLKDFKGGNLKKGNIVRTKNNITSGTNTIKANTLGSVVTNQINNSPISCIIDFHPNKNGIFLEKNKLNSLETLEILYATTYIEKYLEPNIRDIIIGSFFWSEWMKPLLTLKNIRVKNLNKLKFSSIREPLFTKKTGANFQDVLVSWWNQVSSNFTIEAKQYCLMKDNLEKTLINSKPNNSNQLEIDYFYLQLPVTFINRLLQIIEIYCEILSSNTKLENYHTTKEKVLKNNKSNRQMVNYYKKNSSEPKIQNVYSRQELDMFKNIFDTLDIFCSSNGLYENLLPVELAILEWYLRNVSRIKNTSMNRIEQSEYAKINSTNIISMFKKHFNASFEKKYVLFPISMDPAELYMINMYCIPIIPYLGKIILVHENNKNSLSHPINQVHHDLFGHMGYQVNEYYYLSENPVLLGKMLEFKTELIKNILEMHFFINKEHNSILNDINKIHNSILNDINKKYIHSYLRRIQELEIEIKNLESKINNSKSQSKKNLEKNLIFKKKSKEITVLPVLLFEFIHESSENFIQLSQIIFYSEKEFHENYHSFHKEYPFELTIFHPIIFYNVLIWLIQNNSFDNSGYSKESIRLYLEIFKKIFKKTFKTDLVNIEIKNHKTEYFTNLTILKSNQLPNLLSLYN